jgi:putative redox protein
MQQVEATIGRDHYKTVVRAGRHQVLADEPVSLGGTDQGFSPDELLASALAACTLITLRMYADRKQYVLDRIDVTVSVEWNKHERRSVFRKTLSFKGSLQPGEADRLREIADKCPTHVLLTHPIEIETDLA